MATYYSVITKEADGKWYAQFGSYEREEAKQELEDMRESDPTIIGRVIGTGASQTGIDYALSVINNGGRW